MSTNNTVPPTKLYKKLSNIIKEGVSVGKTGYNAFHKYNYATEADVVEAVREVFAKHGLIYQFDMEEATQISVDVVRTKIRFTLIDADSGEQLSSVVYADGQDKGDKSIYKALTGGQKYYLLKSLLISTGDDPEKDTAITTKPTTTKTFKNTTTPAVTVTNTDSTPPVTATVNAPTTTKTLTRASFKRNAGPDTTTTTAAQTDSGEVEF